MKKHIRRIITFAVIVMLLIPVFLEIKEPSAGAFAATFDEKIQENQEKQDALAALKESAEKQKAELEAKEAEAKATREKLQQETDDLSSYIEQLDMELNKVTDRIYELNDLIKQKEADIAQLEIDLAEAEETAAAQYEIMKKRVRYMYENGNNDLWEILFNAGNLIDILNQAEYVSRITEYDNSLLERYNLATESVALSKEMMEVSLADLKSLSDAALLEQDAYLALSADKGKRLEAYMAALDINEELIFSYTEEISSASVDIDSLKQREDELAKEEDQIRAEEEERLRKEEEERLRREEEERLAREAEAERLRKEAEAAAKGIITVAGVELTHETSIDSLIWPLPGDPNIYSYFGYRVAPIAGASTYHKGVDIGGAYGAPIVASAAGTVSIVSYDSSSGNYVVIDHGNGVQTKYLHCSKVITTAGAYVMQGQVIAYVGSTGVSTGPHLHFSLVVNGTFIDPLKYISYTK